MEQRLTNLGIKVQGQARAKMEPSGDDLKAAFRPRRKLADALVDICGMITGAYSPAALYIPSA
jgi:hypothetical protein